MTATHGRVGAIVLAAGSSSRMKAADKQLMSLRGKPVFLHSLQVFEDSCAIDTVVMVFSESNMAEGTRVIGDGSFRKVTAVVRGGERRQDSVRAAISALEKDGSPPEWLLVHDAARPFVDGEMIERGLSAAAETGAAVAAIPLIDTVKLVDGHRVIDTPDRSTLRIVQTPQVFRASLLANAHAAISEDVTDDASMVELIGGSVTVFDGHHDNLKITTPGDLQLAETIYDRRMEQPRDTATRRWGVGFDGHALVAGGPLRLGGVDIEFDRRLEGHSDGDVLLHAVTSAILGAAGLGDMGSNFPSSDKSLAGIDSGELLHRTMEKIGESGWVLEHLDATIIVQQPRMAGHVAAITGQIANMTGLSPQVVNIKVTSTDHVGAIGEGLGIAAQAVATLRILHSQ